MIGSPKLFILDKNLGSKTKDKEISSLDSLTSDNFRLLCGKMKRLEVGVGNSKVLQIQGLR